MLAPIFTHGTYANTIKAIQEGRIKYPGYCWIVDTGQYGFINKYNQLEIIGVPQLTGTLENEIILSTLIDGIYEIKGQHRITATDPTVYVSTSFIYCIIQTIEGKKRIKRITADEIIDYTVEEDLSVTSDAVVTESYLKDKGYADEEYVDAKIAAMKQVILDDVESALPGMIAPIVRPVVEEVIDESIRDIDEDDIDDLFDGEG